MDAHITMGYNSHWNGTSIIGTLKKHDYAKNNPEQKKLENKKKKRRKHSNLERKKAGKDKKKKKLKIKNTTKNRTPRLFSEGFASQGKRRSCSIMV